MTTSKTTPMQWLGWSLAEALELMQACEAPSLEIFIIRKSDFAVKLTFPQTNPEEPPLEVVAFAEPREGQSLIQAMTDAIIKVVDNADRLMGGI